MTDRAKTLIPRVKPAVRSTIAAGFVRALLELAVSKGASSAALLARSGIDPGVLADQDNRIALPRYIRLMRAGQELCGDPALALHFGEAFDMNELSIVGLLGQSAQSGPAVIAELARYNRLIADVAVDGPPGSERLVMRRDGDAFWLIDQRRNPNDFPELTESGFARLACMARRFGNLHMMKAVHVTHPAPAYRTEYDRIFGVPIFFESDRNGLLIDEAAMDFTPVMPSRYVFGIFSARADALIKELESTSTTRGRVESLLLPALHTGQMSMDEVASRMGLGRQTLLRRLKAEGVTFDRVVDELRQTLALDYMNGGKVSVNETAYLLGFSEPAAFSRAFKRWTGESPKAFRARQGVM